jgi:4-alpha-glucanotransferase
MRFPRASGILLHPTSLPGPHGAGDLGPSARHFVDWLVAAQQRLWQILPLGNIGAGHSPYMSTSAFAGNGLLVDLADLQARGWLDAADLVPPAAFAAPRIDHAAMIPWRVDRLRRAAQRYARSAGAAERADHAGFCAAHASWLDDYALFMALAEAHPGRVWSDWEAPLAQRDPAALEAARARHAEAMDFHRFVQWRFFDQWASLRRYANERGVQIVGDAPIYVAWHSAEVWARPELFDLDKSRMPSHVAGVPPDYFSATGQRWGNPLYRWSAHADEQYAWWIERVRRTFELVDVLRIDHFRGFAHYWEIPASEPTAVHGRWRVGPGAALFKAIAAALGPLPIIAEDLGLITPDVTALRKRFALPGMRVLHFAFAEGTSRNLYLPHHHEPDSVVYTGTHDNDTTLGWWAQAGEAERQHVRDYLGTDGREIHWDLIRAALASVADTAIVPLQDVLGLSGEHRMNRPGEGEGHWAWRFDWSQVQPEHAQRLAAMVRLYGRDGATDAT